jgi:hypothetical protein
MGSTHPPLESLLKLSQNCLEGFELSRLNRISNLRKEFHEVLDEWIELEIEARFARWALEYRRMRNCGSPPVQTAAPAFATPKLALRSVAHVSDEFLLPSGNELPPEFPFASIVEVGESMALELRWRFRYVAVSQDASAALRSLEDFADCEARSLGEQPIALPNCDTFDSSSPYLFLSLPHREPACDLKNVASHMSYVLASTDQSPHCIVRYASTFVTNDHSTPVEPNALSQLAFVSRPRLRSSHSADGYAVAPPGSQTDLCVLSSFRLSLRQISLRRAAILLRN